jgi:uncharacterized membrane protein
MDGRAWALILAVIALALGVAARLRAPRNGSKGAPSHGAILLIPCAIIIGTLPWVLQLGETVKNVASVTSIVVSLAAMVLLIIQIGSRRRT